MTPLGIGVSMAAVQATDSNNSYLASGILQGISAGSFLFISLFELFPTALEDGKHTVKKMVAFTVGWALMTALAAVD